MLSSSKNSDPQSLKITQHDKFFSRLLSKDSSLANPSFRIYYGGASGAVPFLWESQPGTPKNMITTDTLPPLTPPPSYHINTKKKKKITKNSSLIHCVLPRIKRSTSPTTHLPSSSLSLSSSTSTSTSSSASSGSHRRRFSSTRSSFSADDEDSIDEGTSSPTSTLRGCFLMLTMKNLLLSIVGDRRSS